MQNWTTAYTWKKMSVHFPATSGYKIFENNAQTSINIDDTIQGYLGNCWMLSSMAAIAEVPARIWRMFDTKTYNAKGIYSISMYVLGAHGNYKAIEGGWMIDAGATLMGTGGDYISTSGLTVD